MPPSISRSAIAIEPSAKEGVPETVNPSVVTVPSKNASLNSVGIGEHPQHLEEVNKQIEKIANAKEKLEVLDEFEPARGTQL